MKYLYGNWKMNHISSDVDTFIKSFNRIKLDDDIAYGIAVPFVHIEKMVKKVGQKAQIGAENVAFAEKGAFTGEISAEMLTDFDVDFCLVGHSERRHVFNETDEEVNKKVKLLIKNGITPVLCIGETLEEFEAGKTQTVLKNQLKNGLKGIKDELCGLIVAYEPVWAIGTGKTATKQGIIKNIKFIKKCLVELLNKDGASVPVLYGGSVKPENAAELLSDAVVDGALVGGASLDAKQFVEIGKNIIRS